MGCAMCYMLSCSMLAGCTRARLHYSDNLCDKLEITYSIDAICIHSTSFRESAHIAEPFDISHCDGYLFKDTHTAKRI